MATIWYVEILKSKLRRELEMRKEENGEKLSSVEIFINTGERKRLFPLSQEEVEALVLNNDHRKSFKLFSSFQEQTHPMRVSRDFFIEAFIKNKAASLN